MSTEEKVSVRSARDVWTAPVVTRIEAGSAESGGQPPSETNSIS